MSWQLFVVIQTAIFSLAAIAGLGLHNRRLQRHNDDLTRLCLAAHDELVNVAGKLRDIENVAPPEQLLKERVKGMTGDDPATVVRRLVLENEITPRDDLAERLVEHLAGEQPEEQEFVERWKAIRAECQQLAMFLIRDYPDTRDAITQLFAVIEPLDKRYGLEPGPLPADGQSPDSTDASAEESDADESDVLDQEALDELLASTQARAAEAAEAAEAPEAADDGDAHEASRTAAT